MVKWAARPCHMYSNAAGDGQQGGSRETCTERKQGADYGATGLQVRLQGSALAVVEQQMLQQLQGLPHGQRQIQSPLGAPCAPLEISGVSHVRTLTGNCACALVGGVL